MMRIAGKKLVGGHFFFIQVKGKQPHGTAEIDFDAGMDASVSEAHHVDAHGTAVGEGGKLMTMVFSQFLQKVIRQGNTL